VEAEVEELAAPRSRSRSRRQREPEPEPEPEEPAGSKKRRRSSRAVRTSLNPILDHPSSD
jgi:hypothetical protein